MYLTCPIQLLFRTLHLHCLRMLEKLGHTLSQRKRLCYSDVNRFGQPNGLPETNLSSH